eukprot:jgi/Mesen1/1930/ME000146S01025
MPAESWNNTVSPTDFVVDALLQRFLPLAKNRIESVQFQDGQYLRNSDPAYEQALDSLALVASHAPAPLLEALLQWRESESPRGSESPKGSSGAAYILQRKLAVECVFTSACIRVVDCCPPQGLSETLWVGLEDFVFDWLICVDRLVPATAEPSAPYELRCLLLDSVAQLAGALSSTRFQTITARFFNELDARVSETVGGGRGESLAGLMHHIPVVDVFTRGAERILAELNGRRVEAHSSRGELLNIIHGMRFLRLKMSTAIDVLATRAFLVKANPLNKSPSKKKTELQHALCQMLTGILTPLADDSGGDKWPPKGVGDSIVSWNATVLQLRSQLTVWVEKQSTLSLQMDKQSKHMQVAYPLITLLMCIGDQMSFERSFAQFLDTLCKLLREKSSRGVALECMHRLLHFYLNVYASHQPKAATRSFLQSVVGQLLVTVKRGVLGSDAQLDTVVDVIMTVARADLDFALSVMVLDLLNAEGLGEPKIIGLRALLAIVHSVLQPQPQGGGAKNPPPSPGSGSNAFGVRNRTSSFSNWTMPSPRGDRGSASLDLTGLSVDPADSPLLNPHITKIRAALGATIKMCHGVYGNMLLLYLSKHPPPDKTDGRMQSLGWVVFRWALRCVPHLLPDQWRDDKMTEIIPVYSICIDLGVRDEAAQVMFRIVKDLPRKRFAALVGMANFILRMTDEYPALIHSSLSLLVQLLGAWRACLVQEASFLRHPSLTPSSASFQSPRMQHYYMDMGEEAAKFDPSGMDHVGLIFLCSVDIQIRRTALELLRGVRALQQDLAAIAAHLAGQGPLPSAANGNSTFVIDTFEESGDEILARACRDESRWSDAKQPAEQQLLEGGSLQAVLEGQDRTRWGRCLSELVKYCAELCPRAVQGARLEVVARMSALTPQDTTGKGVPQFDVDSRLDQWHMYAMFACSCPPEDAPDGGLQSIKDLLLTVLPVVRTGVENAMHAATMALGHSHADICEAMLTELSTWGDEIMIEMDTRKWKNQKLRKEDVRTLVAQVYRLVAQNLWPGELKRRPWLRQHFVRFIDETQRAVSPPSPETLIETQPLRFALAVVLHSLAAELVTAAPDRFDARARKRLFDLVASWCEDPSNTWAPDEAAEYDKVLEQVRAVATVKSKDSNDRLSAEKELNNQAQIIQVKAMSAMAALLYGPCFDSDIRKMAGRVVAWLRFLMENSQPLNFSPTVGTPSVRASLASPMWPPSIDFSRSRKRVSKSASSKWRREDHASPSWRATLARDALLNLLITNPDIFAACIDQCYHQDAVIANSYFTVLAQVYMRHLCPQGELQRLISLILYKVVDPSKRIRDDAMQMLDTLSSREWAGTGGEGKYRVAVVGSLPDSYQQFQFRLSARLAKEHPELSEHLCEEIMQRQLDAVDIIAQHQVLTCMAPWMENLNLVALWDSGWSERLLKSLYYVTDKHGDQFPTEIEKLWSTVASKWRNIIPVLDFLISKGIEDCDSNVGNEIGGALLTYFRVAKRISLYLARISPQQTIDQLVYELSLRRVDEDLEVEVVPEVVRHPVLNSLMERDLAGASGGLLEFSQGPSPALGLQERWSSETPPLLSPRPPTAPDQQGQQQAAAHEPQSHRRAKSGGFNMHWQHRGRGQSFSGTGDWTRTLSENKVEKQPPSYGRSSSGSNLMPPGSGHQSRDSYDFAADLAGGSFSEAYSSSVGTGGGGGSVKMGISGKMSSLIASSAPSLLNSALSKSRLVKLSRADIALILLAEIAYENDEDFRNHLPLLFHVAFVSMDSSEAILLEHAQQLLVNLLYTLAGRHLEMYERQDQADVDAKQQVVRLIKYVQSKKGCTMWDAEDMALQHTQRTHLPSAALLTSLVTSTVDAIFFQNDLRERWGQEALKWAMECTSRHLASRSHQIYRALKPAVSNETCMGLLRCLHRCFSNPDPHVLGFAMELLFTLQVIVESMEDEKVILYPQLFWACVALLNTDFIQIYKLSLDLLARIVDRLSFRDPTAENVLLSSMPKEDPSGEWQMEAHFHHQQQQQQAAAAGGGSIPGGRQALLHVDEDEPKFRGPKFCGVQPLVLKGLLSPLSHAAAIQVLFRITLLPCDQIFGDKDTRLLMQIVGLLPWLCLQLPSGSTTGAIPVLPGASPLKHQQGDAQALAASLAQCCAASGLQTLAAAFTAYAESRVTSCEDLLERVGAPLAAQWFPQHASPALSFLLRLLEKGPMEYQSVVMLILRVLLAHTTLDSAQAPVLHASVLQVLDTACGRLDAVGVLEAILECARAIPGAHASSAGSIRAGARSGGAANAPASLGRTKTFSRSQSILPSLHSSLGGAADLVPPREAALHNTRIALGQVLDTYGSGFRRKEYRKMVPFVDFSASMSQNGSAQATPRGDAQPSPKDITPRGSPSPYDAMRRNSLADPEGYTPRMNASDERW